MGLQLKMFEHKKFALLPGLAYGLFYKELILISFHGYNYAFKYGIGRQGFLFGQITSFPLKELVPW